jgi:hypothetical protein
VSDELNLLLDGVSSAYEALVIDGDIFKSVNRKLEHLDYLLWLEDDRGSSLRGDVRISAPAPLLLKVYTPHWRDWQKQEGALIHTVSGFLHFDDSRERLEICDSGEPLARLVFKNSRMYWESDAGDGILVIASPTVFGDVLPAIGPRLRVSPLAA